MGVNVSAQTAVAPLSLGSTIVGFISFAFTLATVLRVFWGNLQTLWSAPREVEDMLSNLKQALYEERAHLRHVRRGCRGTEHYDEGAFKVLADSIRHLIQQFKRLERPFLREEQHGATARDFERWHARHRRGERRHSSRSRRSSYERPRYYTASDQYYEGAEKGRRQLEDDYYETDYCRIGLWHRYVWLKEKEQVQNMLDTVARIQTRRIAKQVSDLSVWAANQQRGREADEILRNIDARLSRVVGIRPIDPE